MNSLQNTGIFITKHARERFIERISGQSVFGHLAHCQIESCKECKSLLYRLRELVEAAQKYIDPDIVRRVLRAKRVTDSLFHQAIKKYGADRDLEFLIDQDAIFVVLRTDHPRPLLVTVMSADMIDGTVIRSLGFREMDKAFDHWKHEARLKAAFKWERGKCPDIDARIKEAKQRHLGMK